MQPTCIVVYIECNPAPLFGFMLKSVESYPSLSPQSLCVVVCPWYLPWVASLTVKLDILAKVINYQLQSDGRQPLRNTPDGRDVESDPTWGPFNTISEAADKIIIFSAFPSLNQSILDVSQTMLCHLIIRMNIIMTGAWFVWRQICGNPWQNDVPQKEGKSRDIQMCRL